MMQWHRSNVKHIEAYLLLLLRTFSAYLVSSNKSITHQCSLTVSWLSVPAFLCFYSLFSDFYQLLKPKHLPPSISIFILCLANFLQLPPALHTIPDVFPLLCLLVILLQAAFYFLQNYSPFHCLQRILCNNNLQATTWVGLSGGQSFTRVGQVLIWLLLRPY